jgi:hypothetical protein
MILQWKYFYEYLKLLKVKSSIIATIVVAVVVIGGFAVVYAKDPGLFSISTTKTIPSTSPGIMVVSSTEVNSSMSGGWNEVMNVTVGVSNLSALNSAFGELSHSSVSPIPANASFINIKYAQAASFVSRNYSLLAFGYVAFKSINIANMTNQTITRNISKDNLTNVTVGEVSGSFYVYGFSRSGSNYTSVIYGLYSNYLVVGIYHGEKNRTRQDFTTMLSTQVAILTDYKLNFVATEHLLSNQNITSELGSSYNPDFNMSIFLINPHLLYNSAKNTSTYRSEGYDYSSYLNMTSNGSAISGLAFATFSSNVSGVSNLYALGYVQSVNQSFASEAYMNLTTELNTSLRDSGREITNITHNGLQFFVFNISSANGPNITFAVGQKGNYLVFEVDEGSGHLNNQLKTLMEQESYLL